MNYRVICLTILLLGLAITVTGQDTPEAIASFKEALRQKNTQSHRCGFCMHA
jgi:hypothetical protein